jgi:L-asparaginase
MIATACNETKEDKILITHGTDTMTFTASYLAKCCKGKTIVLTGAMVPYKFGSSDGLFNLGSALAFVQVVNPGVYIAINGKIFEADKVKKNTDKGEFENI